MFCETDKKNTLTGKKEGRGKNYGRFLKMIDNLQTPKLWTLFEDD